jgi:serine phosphatase RsbU (regulator of sigma subunit)
MVLGEIDLAARRGVLVQAGHPSPFLVARAGSVRTIGQGGLPIGIVRQASFEEVAFDFSPGDRLLVYSDGLTEAENIEQQGFDQERLQALLEDHAGQSTADLLSTIDQALRNWRGSGTLEDDVTVLILEAESEN